MAELVSLMAPTRRGIKDDGTADAAIATVAASRRKKAWRVGRRRKLVTDYCHACFDADDFILCVSAKLNKMMARTISNHAYSDRHYRHLSGEAVGAQGRSRHALLLTLLMGRRCHASMKF